MRGEWTRVMTVRAGSGGADSETWAEISLAGLLKRVKAAIRDVTGNGGDGGDGGDGGNGGGASASGRGRLSFAETVGHLGDILGALWESRRAGMPFLTSSAG